MPHFQVADVDTSVERALGVGGRVLMQAKGQWAVLLDPNGAAFGIVPVVRAAIPSTDDAPVGRIAWVNLTVADADAARDFYRQVVGWSVQDVEMMDGTHR